MKKFALLLLLSTLALPFPVDAQELTTVRDQALNEGRMEMRVGRLFAAEVAFRRAIASDPQHPMPHYQLADLLARSNRHDEARQEYAAALNLRPDPVVADYCRQALVAYKVIQADQSTTRRRPQAFVQEIPTGGGFLTPLDLPRPDPKGTALRAIDRQAEAARQSNQTVADGFRTTAIRGGDWRARRVRDNAEAAIQQMYNTEAMRVGHRIVNTDELNQRATAMRKQAEYEAQGERQRASERAEDHNEWSRERQAELHETATNLQDQLSMPSLYGFDLKPEGTNLYVRNYKSSKAKIKLKDPRFSVARLLDRGMSEELEKGVPEGFERSIPGEPDRRESVEGERVVPTDASK